MTKLGAKPISAPGWTAQPAEGVKIVDCDVHHNFEQPEQLLPYLPKVLAGASDRSRAASARRRLFQHPLSHQSAGSQRPEPETPRL